MERTKEEEEIWVGVGWVEWVTGPEGVGGGGDVMLVGMTRGQEGGVWVGIPNGEGVSVGVDGGVSEGNRREMRGELREWSREREGGRSMEGRVDEWRKQRPRT